MNNQEGIRSHNSRGRFFFKTSYKKSHKHFERDWRESFKRLFFKLGLFMAKISLIDYN